MVEYEKTAIIASAYIPDFIWVATGGASSGIEEKFKALSGRKVTLFPDLGQFERWHSIAQKNDFRCNHYLEEIASPEEKVQGLNVADYLIKINYKDVLNVSFDQYSKLLSAHWLNYSQALQDFKSNSTSRDIILYGTLPPAWKGFMLR